MAKRAVVLWLAALSGPAVAGDSGWYDPQAVAGQSAQFTQAAEAMAPAFERAQASASRYAGALRAWEEAIDLLSDRVPVEEIDAYGAAKTSFFRRHAVLDQFAEDDAVAFDEAFRAALDRASAGRGWVACTPPGSGLRRMPGGNRDKPACAGADHTDEVVVAVDTDPKLKAAITELLARPWPKMVIEPAPAPPIGQGTVVDAHALFAAGASHALADIDRADAEAREPFEAALEGEPSPDELAQLQKRASEVSRYTTGARQSLAAPVLAAIDKLSAKLEKKGAAGYAWCVRPDVFGGCTPSADAAATQALLADKKVAKLLAKADALRVTDPD